jgi:5-methylcytosine-specific restriction endonuclease McrA
MAMTDVLGMPVLVLNRFFQPVQITTVKRAMVLMYGDAAEAIDEEGEARDFSAWRELDVREGDDALPIVGGALRVPRVVHLHRYDRTPRTTVRLTRRNLMFRDAHQCQYCGRRPALRDLNIDHVTPRSRGGGDSWENLVTACRDCNLRKGWKTPDEANMRLARAPFRPKWTMTAQLLMGAGWRFKEWEAFLKAS